MARPSNVEVNLDKKYMGKSISNTILNTPVDYERLRNSPLSATEVENIKNKYKIKTFSSREEFMFIYTDDARRTIIQDMNIANKTAKERNEKLPFNFRNETTRDNYIDKQITERLDKWYKYYQHRELLILSGQYEEIRLNMYKEQYLSHLKSGNISKEIIKNIEDLSMEDWQKLVQQPDAKVDSDKTRELPSLSNIYSYDSKVDNTANIESEIKEAFKSSGIEFKEYPELNNADLIRKKFPRLTEAYYEGRYDLHQNDSGKWVAPFIGTEDGKNSDLVKELMEYIDKHSDEYQ